MTPFPEDDTKLSHLPEPVRNHPLFRQGYDPGYSNQPHDKHLAEIEQNRLRVLRGGSPALPPFYGVDTSGLRGRLVAGARVMRELSAVSEREFRTEVPCCGRGITIPAPEDDETSPAACCHCRVLYAAAVAEKELGGYNDEHPKFAVFVVQHVSVLAAPHRAGKWEQSARPRRPGRAR
jgi:hypothetical protein